jgi:alkanesulfonate monooxygenase SsuD/methylene tetrahydromethanopterin reductase-like flavin-dependent oxidoreductase (luciferase family)
MQDFVRIGIANAAENLWVGQGALYRVIGGGQRRANNVQGTIQRLYPAGVQGVERGRTFDYMQRCAFLAARLGQGQRARRKIESGQVGFCADFCADGFPVQPSGDHQVKHEPDIVVEPDRDAFADAAQSGDGPSDRVQRFRLDGAQQERTFQPYTHQRGVQNPSLKRIQIDGDVRQFGHGINFADPAPGGKRSSIRLARRGGVTYVADRPVNKQGMSVAAIDFGIFDHLDRRPDTSLAQTYEDRLRLVEAYDAAGFYAYQIAEHHATPLTVAPSPSVFLSAVAQRTKRIKFGPMVYVLPMYHPLRLIEEICMLDHFSGGRFLYGIGKGITPHELGYFGVDPAQARDIYDEILEITLTAFDAATDRLTWHGRHFDFDDVPINIHPVQQPHPPLWIGVGTPDGAAKAGALGMNVLTNSPLARSSELMARYRDAYTGDAADIPKMAICRHTFIAETDAEAEWVMREAYPFWYQHFVALWKLHGGSPVVAAYSEDFDETVSKDLLIFGSPETVRAEIDRYLEKSGTNYFVCRFAFGSLTYGQSRSALDGFVEEVMPHFTPSSPQNEAAE